LAVQSYLVKGRKEGKRALAAKHTPQPPGSVLLRERNIRGGRSTMNTEHERYFQLVLIRQ